MTALITDSISGIVTCLITIVMTGTSHRNGKGVIWELFTDPQNSMLLRTTHVIVRGTMVNQGFQHALREMNSMTGGTFFQ